MFSCKWRAGLVAAVLSISAASSNATPSASPTSLTPSPSPTFTPYPYVDQFDCYSVGDHDQADLCAQWQAARAAQQAANSAGTGNIISTIALLVSGLGMVGLVFTLYQSNLSLIEARRAATEARRIGQTQVRCYIAIKRIRVFIREDDLQPCVSFQIANMGQSPAFISSWKANVYFGWDAGKTKPFSSDLYENDRLGTIIAPSSAHQIPSVIYELNLEEKDIAKIRNDDKWWIKVYVTVSGNDAFGDKFRSFTGFTGPVQAIGRKFKLIQIAHQEIQP